MQHDTTNTPGLTVSAEEDAILGRFAARASEAAELPSTEDGSYIML